MASKKPELPKVGANILALRKKAGLSLEALANLSGVSKAMISQVEHGKVNPTIATTWKIATGLGEDFSALIGSGVNERIFYVSKSGASHLIQNGDGSATLRVITPPQLVDVLELYWLTLKPRGALLSEPHFSFTEEILTVISGNIEVMAGEKSVLLEKGDSVRYHADVRHAIREVGGEKAEAHLTVYFKETSKK